MSIVVNIYYTSTNGNARKFAEEMESSGTAAAIRKEAGNYNAKEQTVIGYIRKVTSCIHLPTQ